MLHIGSNVLRRCKSKEDKVQDSPDYKRKEERYTYVSKKTNPLVKGSARSSLDFIACVLRVANTLGSIRCSSQARRTSKAMQSEDSLTERSIVEESNFPKRPK